MHVGSPRTEWSALPSAVRAAIEGILGAPVRSAATQQGGFSPGVAALVELEDGRRAFVKVADESFNPMGASLHRREAAFMASCPDVPAARLWGVHDDGGWVALVVDAIDGRLPELPWQPADLTATLDALAQLRARPGPGALARSVDVDAGLFTGWRSLQDGTRDVTRLDPWVQAHLEGLVALEERWPEAYDGDRIVHGDVRADNVLLTGRGAVLVDWASPSLGAPWADLVIFLPSAELAGAPPVEQLWAATAPSLPEGILPVAVAALAGFFVGGSLDPDPPGLPTLRRFQADQGAVCLRWLRGLLDWG